MNKYADRLWLVILGVAVAILVTLTTIYWNVPSAERSGTRTPQVKTTPHVVIPKIGKEVIKFLVPLISVPKSRK